MNIFTFFNKKIKQCHLNDLMYQKKIVDFFLKYDRLHVSFSPFIITLYKLLLEVDMRSHHVNYVCACTWKKSDKKRHKNIYVISCVGSGEEELEKGKI